MAARKSTKKAAETAEKPVEAEQKPVEKTYSEADVQKLVAEAVANAMASYRNQQMIQATPKDERVNLLWQAPVADDNVQEFGANGRYGRIVGPTGNFFVPKDEFSNIIDSFTRMCLERRWLIVVSGLNDEERKIYGVDYREGEYLDKTAFARVAEQGPKLLELYPQLCDGSRRIVAGAVYQGWKEGKPSINRDLVESLAALCKEIDPKETTFQTILKEMAEKAANG